MGTQLSGIKVSLSNLPGKVFLLFGRSPHHCLVCLGPFYNVSALLTRTRVFFNTIETGFFLIVILTDLVKNLSVNTLGDSYRLNMSNEWRKIVLGFKTRSIETTMEFYLLVKKLKFLVSNKVSHGSDIEKHDC